MVPRQTEVGGSRRPRGGEGAPRRGDAERRDGDGGRREAARREFGPQAVGRGGGVHHDAVGHRRHGGHARGVAPDLRRPGVFRVAQRDQVVDEGDEGGAGAAERRDGRRPVERAVRHEEENAPPPGAARFGESVAQRPPAGAEAEPRQDRQPGAPGLLPRARHALPRGLDRVQQRGHGRVRHRDEAPGRALRREGALPGRTGQPPFGVGHLDSVYARRRGAADAEEEARNVQDDVHDLSACPRSRRGCRDPTREPPVTALLSLPCALRPGQSCARITTIWNYCASAVENRMPGNACGTPNQALGNAGRFGCRALL